MKAWLRSTIFYCLGVLISTFCSIVLAKLYNGTEWKIVGPLLFAVALVILSSHFGAIISLAGAVLGAAMFAFFLYNPENSFRVNSETDRSTLAWMMLISVSLSYLLYPTRKVHAIPAEREHNDRSNSIAPRSGGSHEIRRGVVEAPVLAKQGESVANCELSDGQAGEGRG